MTDGAQGRVVVDARGLFCPAPIIKTSEALRNVVSGSVVEVVSDDPAIESDLPAWCRSMGHTILSSEKRGADFHYRVQKK